MTVVTLRVGTAGGQRQPEPREFAELAEEHYLAGRHHTALEALRPYFATRKLDPAEALDFVRNALNVSRVLREMGLAETIRPLVRSAS